MSQAAARQGKRWTAQDERLLRHYTVQGLTARQIAEKLGRTRNAVLIKRGIMINQKEKKTMYEDYDPGLCVGCEWCYWGSPQDCPQCKTIPEEDGDDIVDK